MKEKYRETKTRQCYQGLVHHVTLPLSPRMVEEAARLFEKPDVNRINRYRTFVRDHIRSNKVNLIKWHMRVTA